MFRGVLSLLFLSTLRAHVNIGIENYTTSLPMRMVFAIKNFIIKNSTCIT